MKCTPGYIKFYYKKVSIILFLIGILHFNSVLAQNQAPSFTKGADQTVNEDAGAQTVSPWATNIDDGDAEETQNLTFNIGNDNNSLFIVQPAIDASGILTYTPADDANGSTTVTVSLNDDGGTAGGGVDTSPDQTFTITISAVNDVPGFTKGSDETLNEDAGAQTVNGWATSISTGPSNESGQTASFNVSNDNNSLFSVQPNIDASGNLTYTPADDANGSATVTVSISDDGGTTNGGVDTSSDQTFTISVNAVNDAPSFIKGSDQTVNEDAGAQTVNGWATSISTGPSNESGQTVSFNVSNDNNSLFSVQPSIDATGNLTYTPADDANGSATVTVSISDDGGTTNGGLDTSSDQTFTITVNAVNDVPSFTKGSDQSMDEDAGTQTVNGWATSISAGPSDESGQTVSFNVSNDNNSLFSVQPSINASGNLTYTPADDANGSATITVNLSDNGGTINGGVDTSSDQTFTITVNSVNDVPSFTKGSNQTLNEDAGAQTVNSWATDLVKGPSNESSQVLSFNLSNDNNSLFSVQPNIDASGNLTYTPAADANGSATVTVSINDDGGTANGGADTSADQTFTITINVVNDVPSFTKGSDEIVNEDAGAQTVNSWASAISSGPSNESSQTISFNVSNDNNSLFSSQPMVDASGNLTYTPADNIHGSATVTISISDDGGTTNGGVDTSADQSFTITVNSVNDVPSFTKGSDQTIDEDAGAQTINGWATDLVKGPSNESSQVLSFNTSNDNNSLFSVQPSIDASGNLTYTPADDANGFAIVTVSISDDGGTTNGGVDTSANQSFTISIDAVNDMPSFTKGADETVNEDVGAQTVNGWATSISAGPSNEGSQTVSFNVSNDNNGLFSVQPAIDASGNLTYTSSNNNFGSATVTVSISDDGGTTNGGIDTSSDQTFTITINSSNDAPSFTKGADEIVNEDAGVQTVNSWATSISRGPSDESGQSLNFNVSNNNNSLFSVQPNIDASGNLTYTPADDANGSATVTVSISDDGGTANGGVDTSSDQTFTITVNAVNDIPSFVKGSDETVNEDAGDQTVNEWATSISIGPSNESIQTASFNVSNDNNSLFSVQPSIDASGILTYTPADDANGSATVTVSISDDGGTTNGGVDTSSDQTFTITVSAVNDAPSFSKGTDQTVNEDAGAQTVNSWVSSLSTGPSDESGQSLNFNVNNDNNSLFSSQPSIDASGNLTYTPASDANGSATVSVSISDDGGTTNGGIDTSTDQTFIITVNSVNDVPSFTKGSDQTVNEDAGAQTLNGWATDLVRGPSNESSQALTFNASNDNNSLFSVQPNIDASGNLSYTPADDANGSATVTVSISDDGGTTNGGVDTSSDQTFTITIDAVNDVPSFTIGSDQTVNEDAGAQTVNSWATSLSTGPSDESGQSLNFNVSNDNNSLFSSQPSIDASGNLTYTPASDANGSATVSVSISDDGGTTNGGIDTSTDQTFIITVNSVNDVPSFTKGSDQTVNEDARAQTLNGWATDLVRGPSNESSQALTFNASNDNNSLFSVQPSINASGNLSYTPADDANGSATVTVSISDDGGTTNGGVDTSADQTFTITIDAVNDVPSFSKGSDQTVNEDAGAQTINSWASGISSGPSNESSQSVSFNISNDNNSLFSSQPIVDASGNLTYTPADNIHGSATVTISISDDGGTTNGGVDTSADQTFTITINSVNDVPTFTKGSDQTVDEDAGVQTINGWATDLVRGPSNESSQVLSFNVSNDNNSLFSVQPNIDASGNLTYTPADDANGSATITVSISDDGGTTNGGVDTSADQTFAITIDAVNDVPSFTKGTDETVNEDAGAQTINGWATDLVKGPSNEDSQALSFNVSNDNNSLFSSQPMVNASGALMYTPADNIHGFATVTISISDDGGTTNGGEDTSSDQTFTITVNSVNDVPSFTKGAHQTVDEDAGAQSINGWATDLVRGPSNESSQVLSFNTSNDNNSLFTVQPDIDASGNLSYTPADDANGSATITVSLSDDGGTTNGGIDTSADQTFAITINAVNDVPSFTKGSDQTVLEDVGVQTVEGWATDLVKGPTNETSQTLSFNVSNDNNGLFSVQPDIDSNGDLTYTPADDANGSATVTVSISDDGGTTNGGVDTSADQTFTITVNAVNDVPTFTKGSDETVNEDAGAQTVNEWATSISTGPSDESGQLLSFNVSNDNNSLFSTQPGIDANGILTFTPADDANGSTTVTVSLSDDGGKTNGGVDISSNQTFTITIQAVNDVPSFTKGSDQTVLEDVGIQTVESWATNLVKGPSNEDIQTLSFNVSNNNISLFSVQPKIDSDGNLTYTPADDANGSATITVSISDDAGISNGGVDTSTEQTFTITIDAVNDVPAFIKGANQTVLEDGGGQIVNNWATNINAGAINESAQVLIFSVSNNNNSLFAVQPDIDPITGNLSYTPANNANGSTTVTVSISDNGGTTDGGVDMSEDQTFTITIQAVNDVPSFTKGSDQTVLEDVGAQTIEGWATGLVSGPSNESGQVLNFNVDNDNNSLFEVQPDIDAVTGNLTYTPADDANGSATITVSISDDGGISNGGVDTSADQMFTITIEAVNDVPGFTKGANQTVNEDAGAQIVNNWATEIGEGAFNETEQILTFNVSNNNNDLFEVQPQIDVNTGDLTYTPADDIHGSATITVCIKDDGGIANGGVDTSEDQTFTITVNSVNDVPSFIKGSDQTVLEDVGPQIVNGWASDIENGPENENSQVLNFNVGNDNNSLFAVQPDIDALTGNLTYTPSDNANGSTIVTVSISDDGGTDNGGIDTSADQTFTITIVAVNDVPSFAKGADQTVSEDSGTQTVDSWANNIVKGPFNESSQVISFNVSNNNNNLFAVHPDIDALTGNLTYTPADNANGSATVIVSISDDGGTINGGVDTSENQTFTITVNAVNDVPSFSKGSNLAVNEDEGGQNVNSWASLINAGPPDESAQVLTFNVITDNTSLFSVQPAIDSLTGNLSYTLADDAYGQAMVTISLSDNGGTLLGGVDTSSEQNFTIIVNPVNDVPKFTKGLDQTVDEDSGVQTINGWATELVRGPSNESEQTLTFNVSNDNNSLFSSQPAIDASGNLTYTPADDANGSAMVTVSISDDGGTINGGVDTSSEQTFMINVIAINDKPTAICISNNYLGNNIGEFIGDTEIGTLITTDVDILTNNDQHTYTFINGGTDNDLFSIDNNRLRVKNGTTLKVDEQLSYNVRIQTEDNEGETEDKLFTIYIGLDQKPFKINAGSDVTICNSGEPIQLSGAIVSYIGNDIFKYNWRDNQGGTFENENTLNPIYRTREGFSGQVIITFSAEAENQDHDLCEVYPIEESSITLTINNGSPPETGWVILKDKRILAYATLADTVGLSYEWGYTIIGEGTEIILEEDGLQFYITGIGQEHQLDFLNNQYWVKVTNESNCSIKLYYDQGVVTDLEEQLTEVSSKIYPNPNKGAFTYSLENNYLGIFAIEILDYHGRKVFSKRYEKKWRKFDVPIQLNGVKSGVYILMVLCKYYKPNIHKVFVE